MKYALWTILTLAIFGFATGCQMETVNIVIEDGGQGHTKNPAVVKYDGHEATAAKVFIIKIDRSPIKMGQKQEDVGNPDTSVTGL